MLYISDDRMKEFNVDAGYAIPEKPVMLSQERGSARLDEAEDLLKALNVEVCAEDMAGVVCLLLNIIHSSASTLMEMGIDADTADTLFNAVHNARKVRAVTDRGKPGYVWDDARDLIEAVLASK